MIWGITCIQTFSIFFQSLPFSVCNFTFPSFSVISDGMVFRLPLLYFFLEYVIWACIHTLSFKHEWFWCCTEITFPMKHKAKNKKKDINHASLPKVFARTCSRCINRSVLHVLAFLEQIFNSYISLLKNLFLCNVSGMPLSRDIFILCKHPDKDCSIHGSFHAWMSDPKECCCVCRWLEYLVYNSWKRPAIAFCASSLDLLMDSLVSYMFLLLLLFRQRDII